MLLLFICKALHLGGKVVSGEQGPQSFLGLQPAEFDHIDKHMGMCNPTDFHASS